MFVNLCDVLFGVTIRGCGEGAQDVQAGLCLDIDSTSVVCERHPPVVGHTKNGWRWVIWNFSVV